MCAVHPNHHSPLLAGVRVRLCEQATLLPAQVSEDNTKVRRSPLQPLKPKEEKSTEEEDSRTVYVVSAGVGVGHTIYPQTHACSESALL